MPQGLTNALTAFNRVAAYVTRFYFVDMACYSDDAFIHSKTEDELSEVESHERHLNAVLKTLE